MIEREGRWAIDTDEDCRFVEPPTVILTDRDLEDLEKLIKSACERFATREDDAGRAGEEV